MFRPFLNEVLIGKVRSCTAEGLRVSVDFFDDIFVPKSNILMDNEFRHEGGRQKWVWLYEDEGETTEMFIEPGDRIRFRVAEEIFEDSKPKMGGEIQDKVIPYKIIAAIDDDGLGPVSWWN